MNDQQTPTNKASCETCGFWLRLHGIHPVEEHEGECRRYPPQLMHDPEDGPYSLWPSTSPEEICGEYRQRMNG